MKYFSLFQFIVLAAVILLSIVTTEGTEIKHRNDESDVPEKAAKGIPNDSAKAAMKEKKMKEKESKPKPEKKVRDSAKATPKPKKGKDKPSAKELKALMKDKILQEKAEIKAAKVAAKSKLLESKRAAKEVKRAEKEKKLKGDKKAKEKKTTTRAVLKERRKGKGADYVIELSNTSFTSGSYITGQYRFHSPIIEKDMIGIFLKGNDDVSAQPVWAMMVELGASNGTFSTENEGFTGFSAWMSSPGIYLAYTYNELEKSRNIAKKNAIEFEVTGPVTLSPLPSMLTGDGSELQISVNGSSSQSKDFVALIETTVTLTKSVFTGGDVIKSTGTATDGMFTLKRPVVEKPVLYRAVYVRNEKINMLQSEYVILGATGPISFSPKKSGDEL
eukprot:CAMPEP_0182427518 /NCGR_PEP_ID=MMETSP1167-20130531/18106_1 /TAXON_ID=2988 /ORGANISM="Mallomonas Sp, Strain CCMP3275" /LENGTH=387 /DNA_ID=CAMNT_0024609819 /DNA_START=46 /DNA_END=1209 /DNA_ORIENTATION=+